jgi:release factor glutamine methyltransferase
MLGELKQKLRCAGVENPDLHLRVVLRDVGGFSDVDILLNRLPENLPRAVLDALDRLERGEPLSRVLGYREFYGRRFYLNDATLDPRPDSETLVDAVLTWVMHNNKKDIKILDLGTGTGCLLLTLLAETEEATGVGVDLSIDAISMAQKNARALKLESRAMFQTGNWFEGITDQFDVIISNPPYIRTDVIANLESSVKNHDPFLALDGGADGLSAYKILLSNLKNHLVEGGRAFFEIGFDQADDLARLVGLYGANLIHTHPDLAGHPRVVEIAYGDK